MNNIRTRYISLCFLAASFTIPASSQGTAPGSDIASKTFLSSDGARKLVRRVYDNGLGDAVQEAEGVSGPGGTRSGPATPVDTDHRYYCGNVVYERGVTRLLTDEGYVTFSETGAPIYHYYLRDHLGNIRVVMGQTGAVEQVSHYYAFGGLMRESTNPGLQPYKYGGKEIDRFSGLDAYDFGARSYFADRMQWGSMDPLCEKYYSMSPYVYGRNNPLRYIDPDGNDDWDKIVGYIVGTATNIIPFPRSFRDLYTPTDAGDYNIALHNTDNAFTVVGEGMSNAGKGGAAIGVSIVATAGIVEVGSGGTATLVSTPAAAAGLELTEISVATGLAGNLLQMNAAKNKSDGYNRGGHKSSTRNTDRHYNQKKKEIHKNILNQLRNQRKKLRNMQRTPETRNELKQLEKQIKHEERKSHDTGETHHRR